MEGSVQEVNIVLHVLIAPNANTVKMEERVAFVGNKKEKQCSIKRCKYCSEEILQQSSICKHCQKFQNFHLDFFTAANILSVFLLIVAIIQTYSSLEENIKAKEASNQSIKTLKEVEIIKAELIHKEKILKGVVKASYENQYLFCRNVKIKDCPNEVVTRLNDNAKHLSLFVEPDKRKATLWVDSLNNLNP